MIGIGTSEHPDGQIQPKERASSLRLKVIESLKRGGLFKVEFMLKNGDDFIRRAAYKRVIDRLCNEEKMGGDGVIFSTQGEGLDLFRGVTIAGSNNRATNLSTNEKSKQSYYLEKMNQLATALGVTLTSEDLASIPELVPCDSGPLKNYDEHTVRAKVEQIKSTIHDREVIVISQAGSESMKRLNTSQVIRLARMIRKLKPNSYIVLLSDRPLLYEYYRKIKLRLDGWINVGFPVSTHVTNSERYTEAQVKTFKQELRRSPEPKDNNDFNSVIEIDGTSINDLLAWLRVAKRGVFTDGYWMHLAASQGLNGIALFTEFRATRWAPKNMTSVESDLLQTTDFDDSLGWIEYRQASNYGPGDYGINNADINKLEHYIAKL